MFTSKRLATAIGLLAIASMIITACGPTTTGTPQVIVQTQIVQVQGTPQVITVTATPEPPKVTEFNSKDPTTLVYAKFGDVDTLDPALDYETAGGEILQNVYDTLVFYNKGNPVEYIPQLATEVPSKENGGISADGMTYTFKIRQGVKFHDGTDMTPGDVAYTFQRGLLQGGTASPQWLFYEAFFGTGLSDIAELVDPDNPPYDDRATLSAADPAKLEEVCKMVTDAMVADDATGTVTFHLAQSWGPMLATVAQFWGSIQSKAWVSANGGWDGDCKTWQNFYAPTSADMNTTQVGSSENGTGPFILDHWTPGEEVVLKANENYWRTEPAWEGGPTGAPKLKTIIIKEITEFGTRLAMLQAGDADVVIQGGPADWPQLDQLVGETCTEDGQCAETDPNKAVRVWTNLPQVTRADAFITFNINTEGGNNFIGSGKLDGNGIPLDFFSDIHVRKAFAYCFDWDAYIRDALQGAAVQANDVFLPGMIGDEADGAHYSYDPAKCEEEFKASTWKSEDGKSLWDVGFRMTVAYNAGNTARQTIGQIFQANIGAVNDKFIVEVTQIPWPTFLANQRAKKLPMFFSGWIEDIHDPHNWIVPYTTQTYGSRQNLPADLKAQYKDFANRGVSEADPAKRAEIYHEFNKLYYDTVPTILLANPTTRRYQQRWVEGWYWNPIFSEHYFYPMSKK